jgi:hypothetical protein
MQTRRPFAARLGDDMAYVTGTSTDAHEFYADLISFLTTNAALTGAAPSQAWVNVWEHDDGPEAGVVLRGPGLSATDEIYIGLSLQETAPGDSWRMNIVGMTGVNAGATSITGHVNVAPVMGMLLDVAPMTRWFVASGRRFVVVAKISTVYEMAYGGLFLPYGTPANYPYPLFVGGSARTDNTDTNVVNTWRSTSDGHAHAWFCKYAALSNIINPPAAMLDPIGQWLECLGKEDNSTPTKPVVIGPRNYGELDYRFNDFAVETRYNGSTNNPGYNIIQENIGECFDGSYALTPFTLLQSGVPAAQTFGVLDSCYKCPGHGNSSENIVTVGGVDHLVIQNVFRTGVGEFWALKLE